MAKTPPSLPPAVADALETLNEVDASFLLIYQGNGFNATAAYKATHPRCQSQHAAEVEGSKLLRKPEVAAALKQVRSALLAEHGMDAEEATALVAMRARMDVAGCYDDAGRLLPPNKWPKALRHSVKGWKGDGSITLVDPQRATETILQMLGKLKNTIDLNHFDHSGYLAEAERLWEEKHGNTQSAGARGSGAPQGGKAAEPEGRDRQRGGEAPASARDARGEDRAQGAGRSRQPEAAARAPRPRLRGAQGGGRRAAQPARAKAKGR